MALQVAPPLVLYSKVPPLPVTVPMAMDPPTTEHAVQVLFTILKLPVGGAGGVQAAGAVTPTGVLLLLHPFDANTLASIVRGVGW